MPDPSFPRWPWRGLAFVLVGALAILRFNGASPRTTVYLDSSLAGFDGAELQWEARNEYTARDGFAGHEYPWLEAGQLVEPHVVTTLKLASGDSEQPGCELYWHVDGSFATGASHEVTFKQLGKYTVTVKEFCGSGDEQRVRPSYTRHAVCRYVRREVRQLLPRDRDVFFRTARVLWDQDGVEGRRKYGQHFLSAEELTVIHATLAGDRECDHMHDGNGFLTQHAVLSTLFERSVQSVEPSCSLPYWDFAQDGETTYNHYSGNFDFFFNSSELFTDGVFGQTNTSSNVVDRGLWAFTKVPRKQWKHAAHNSYGLLRAPWNNLNTEYVTRKYEACGISPARGNLFPRCYTHFESVVRMGTFASTVSAADSWAQAVQLAPHGNVHLFLGGMLECTQAYDHIHSQCGLPQTLVDKWRTSAFGVLKSLWRYHLTEFPTYCSADTPLTECTYSCSDLTDMIAARNVSDIVATLVPGGWDFGWMSAEQRVCLASALCNAHVVTGDHIEASSPLDISFWPVHPTIERLYQFKVLVGMFNDSSWPDDAITSDIDIQIDCYGHRPSDQVLDLPRFRVKDPLAEIDVNLRNELGLAGITNRDVLEALVRTTPGAPALSCRLLLVVPLASGA